MAFLKISTIGAAAATAASIALASTSVNANGAWQDAPLDKETTDLVYKAVSNRANYDNSVKKTICVDQVQSVKEQIVNGVNYQYDVTGCTLLLRSDNSANDTEVVPGSCGKSSCKRENFQVSVYSQPWTNTLQVKDIETIATPVNDAKAGTWKPMDVTAENSALLFDALNDLGHYKHGNEPRICASKIMSVQTQIVSGTKYQYTVDGCPLLLKGDDNASSSSSLGQCGTRQCEHGYYQVIVYSQPWTDTLEIENVQKLLK